MSHLPLPSLRFESGVTAQPPVRMNRPTSALSLTRGLAGRSPAHRRSRLLLVVLFKRTQTLPRDVRRGSKARSCFACNAIVRGLAPHVRACAGGFPEFGGSSSPTYCPAGPSCFRAGPSRAYRRERRISRKAIACSRKRNRCRGVAQLFLGVIVRDRVTRRNTTRLSASDRGGQRQGKALHCFSPSRRERIVSRESVTFVPFLAKLSRNLSALRLVRARARAR